MDDEYDVEMMIIMGGKVHSTDYDLFDHAAHIVTRDLRDHFGRVCPKRVRSAVIDTLAMGQIEPTALNRIPSEFTWLIPRMTERVRQLREKDEVRLRRWNLYARTQYQDWGAEGMD
jgi:hypothetical protein